MSPNFIREDMPMHKMYHNGAAYLSKSELLSLIISGNPADALDTAKVILADNDNNLGYIARLSIDKLSSYAGMTNSRATRIAAMFEIGRRRQCEFVQERNFIRTSGDVVEFLKGKMSDLNHEIFMVIYLNKGQRIVDYSIVGMGGITGTVADTRIILKKALEKNAVAIMLTHNHPSGNLRPSNADKELTKNITEAARLMDIEVLDHIIVAEDKYLSFKDEGLL